jgi:hypothetical protein
VPANGEEAGQNHRNGHSHAGDGDPTAACAPISGEADLRRRDHGRDSIPGVSVAVDLDQPLVADTEAMRDLVQYDVLNLSAQHVRVPPVEPFERPAALVERARAVS